jgi:hypothetical protein
MTVFAGAIDALYANANFATAAVYAPASSPAIEVTILWDRPDESIGLAGIATRLGATVARVRVSEIADPKKGETLTIDGTVYAIGNRDRDPLALEWRLDLKGP